MTSDEYLQNCKHLLYSLTSKDKLEQVLDAGVTADCFYDEALKQAFVYLQRLLRGKSVSVLDMKRRFGISQGNADPMIWAPIIVSQHLINRIRQVYSNAEDTLDTDPVRTVQAMREQLAQLQLPITQLEAPVESPSGKKPPPTPWVIRDFVPQDWPCLLYGRGGTAKSYLATLLAMCVASGQNFLNTDFWVVKQMPVLYCDWEMDKTMFLRREHELCQTAGLSHLRDSNGNLEIPELHYMRPLRPLQQMLGELYEAVSDYRVGLLIIDSFGFATLRPNNKAKDPASDVLETFYKLQQLPCTTFVIDHEPHKGTHPYGSIYKLNAPRYVWTVKSCPGEKQNTTYQQLHLDKHNVGRHQADIFLHMDWKEKTPEDYEVIISLRDESDVPAEMKVKPRPERSNRAAILRIIMREGRALTSSKIHKLLKEEIGGAGVTPATVYNNLWDLVERKELMCMPFPNGAGSKKYFFGTPEMLAKKGKAVSIENDEL